VVAGPHLVLSSAAHDTRDEFQRLASTYNEVLAVTAGIVIATILIAAFAYRRRSGREPSRREKADLVEIVYALALAGVAAYLVAITFNTENRIDALASNTRVQLDVTGFQWGWRIDYAGENVSVVGDNNAPPTFAVPAGQTIELRLRSRDVIHAFWIPSIRFKRDAWPTYTNRYDVVFDRPGRYVGRCAEFCGLHHSDMGFSVQAMPPSAYRAWLEGRK
jgi:cytochrome c oxidase subunit 2